MISFDLPDLYPSENPVACMVPDDYGVIDTSDLNTVRRDDPMSQCSGWDRDSGVSPTLVADEGADRPARQPAVADVECLDVHRLGLTLPNGRALLSNVSFSARPGSLTAIIGPSGAGKSTLAKPWAGLSHRPWAR